MYLSLCCLQINLKTQSWCDCIWSGVHGPYFFLIEVFWGLRAWFWHMYDVIWRILHLLCYILTWTCLTKGPMPQPLSLRCRCRCRLFSEGKMICFFYLVVNVGIADVLAVFVRWRHFTPYGDDMYLHIFPFCKHVISILVHSGQNWSAHSRTIYTWNLL